MKSVKPVSPTIAVQRRDPRAKSAASASIRAIIARRLASASGSSTT